MNTYTSLALNFILIYSFISNPSINIDLIPIILIYFPTIANPHIYIQIQIQKKGPIKKKMFQQPPHTQLKKINYVECEKSGLHYGEVCNMVCIDTKCLDDLLCCCVCIQQSHKKHETKPLKNLMKQAQEQALLIKPSNFNLNNISNVIKNNQNIIIQIFQNYKKQIISTFDHLLKILNLHFMEQLQQIKIKNSNPVTEVQSAFSAIYSVNSSNQLKQFVRKLVAMVQNKQKDLIYNSKIDQPQLIQNINIQNQSINRILSTNFLQITKKIKQWQKLLQQCITKKSIWKPQRYQFSSTYKHNDIKLITDYHVKSQNNPGYKFSILQPDIENKIGKKSFHFKIKQCSSNWIAVGICHKNIVVSKNYAFNFNSLGHGGYMISANGGTWSNTNHQFNNKIKAFKFGKGDIVSVIVKLEQKTILFKKKQQTFQIGFNTIPNDLLHPCVLFYYLNDEVQCLATPEE